jgi:hypothetical protein
MTGATEGDSRRKESANEHHHREQSSFSIFHIPRSPRDFDYLDRVPFSREQRVQSASKASDKAKRAAREDHRATERGKQSATVDHRQLARALVKIIPQLSKIFVLAVCFASVSLADDFKTTEGKEYKNVTISRVEPDGIVLKTKSGISKVYFAELPKVVQERFHYDPQKAAEFTSQTKNGIDQALHQRADANARAAENAAGLAEEYEQRQAIVRQQAAEEAQKAQRAASVKAAIEHGGIIPGMTMDECIRAAGKPRTVNRTTDEQGNSTEQWWYGAGWVYFQNGVVTQISTTIDGQDPRAASH